MTTAQSREGFSIILDLIRQSRMQATMTMGAPRSFLPSHRTFAGSEAKTPVHHDIITNDDDRRDTAPCNPPTNGGVWARWRSWLRSG